MLNGIAHILIRYNLIDREYIEQHTTGFDEAGEIRWRTIRRSASHEITGLSEDLIFKTAFLYGRAKAGFIGWTMGVNHSTIGTATVNAICNLALLTGKSAAPALRRFPSPASATRWARARPALLPVCRDIANSRTQRIARNSPRCGTFEWSGFPCKRGLAYPDIVEAAVAKKIRALWIIATNPAGLVIPIRTCCGTALESRLSCGAGRLSSDADHGTGRPGASRRDLGRERRHLHELRDAREQSQQGRGAAGRSAIGFRYLSARRRKSWAAAKQLFPGWTTPEDAFNEWRRVSRGRLCDYSGISYELLAAARRGSVAVSEGSLNGAEAIPVSRLYADGNFQTPMAAPNSFARTGSRFPEQPSGEYPFILNTGRTVEHWHTRTKTREVPILERLSPRAGWK